MLMETQAGRGLQALSAVQDSEQLKKVPENRDRWRRELAEVRAPDAPQGGSVSPSFLLPTETSRP